MIELKYKKNLLLDLDGTVYQDLESVFGQVSKLMTKYISEKLKVNLVKAKELQTNYFYKYNTSLNGLMIHHDIPPLEFLNYVHNIDLSFMKKDSVLREQLKNLDMRKLIFTNGSADHAKNVLSHLGIEDLFEGIFDITDAKYQPKPEPKAFDLMVKKFGINPKDTIYVEDIAKNLSIGKERGCSTVWLKNNEQWGKIDSDKDYIDYKIENLSLFLKEIRLLKSN
jgi:putative hydrolase of the HAD superfamily|tara:strand:- start:7542 stop:8213 length:672 start_codon:yes stop_codon:yes gene_type:complete